MFVVGDNGVVNIDDNVVFSVNLGFGLVSFVSDVDGMFLLDDLFF